MVIKKDIDIIIIAAPSIKKKDRREIIEICDRTGAEIKILPGGYELIEKLLILDIYENNAYDIQNELRRKYPNLNMEAIIASVRDKVRIDDIFKKYRSEVVFHAAGVPRKEACPITNSYRK